MKLFKEEKHIIPFGTYYTWENSKGEFNTQYNRANNPDNCALTITCAETGNVLTNDLRIRKLTPKECMRLMAFDDIDTERLYEAGLSDGAIFHISGDSIIVKTLERIFEKLC